MKRYKFSYRKRKFATFYLPSRRDSESGGNAYRSALRASYSESYAKKIMSYMHWTELARIAEESGVIKLEDHIHEYAYRNIRKR